MQAYSNPKRESEPHALPDVEVWQDDVIELTCRCGVYEIHGRAFDATDEQYCPSCEKELPRSAARKTGRTAWFWWSCFPGCLPDSDPFGPFATQAEALADARQDTEGDEE